MRSLGDYASLDSSVVPWLCRLADDPDERVKLAALAVLGRLEDRRSLAALRKALESPNSRVRVYAEEALARVGSSPSKT
jgi:HEAT repeat protein